MEDNDLFPVSNISMNGFKMYSDLPVRQVVGYATAVVQAVVTDVADGDVVLLHDMRGSSVEAALAIVDSLLRRGFQFVTASELAAIRNTLPQPGAVYTRFR